MDWRLALVAGLGLGMSSTAIGLAVLNRFGITAFNDLPVTRFSVDEAGIKAGLTPTYSFTLAENFRPRADYLGDIQALGQPVAVVVGQRDEVFHADRFAPVFAGRTPAIPVIVLPEMLLVPEMRPRASR